MNHIIASNYTTERKKNIHKKLLILFCGEDKDLTE